MRILAWIKTDPSGGEHIAEGGRALTALRLDAQGTIKGGDGTSRGVGMRAGLAIANGVADTHVHVSNVLSWAPVDYENDYQIRAQVCKTREISLGGGRGHAAHTNRQS